MNRKLIVSHGLVALAFAGLGWCSHSIHTADRLTPAESIMAAWRTQLDVLTTHQGEQRTPGDSARIARISLASLSMGLAVHHGQLTSGQRRELAPFIARVRALEQSTDAGDSLAVLRCIEAAGETGPIDKACISRAVGS